jgi:predicted acylesterase/phospholipase RssA
MPYTIELISIGGDFYPLLQSSAKRLNGVQTEFDFRLTLEGERQSAEEFRREEYLTTEIWEFLQKHKAQFGGNRPYIIVFVDKPLRSPILRNIFGSHQARNGLAAATLHNSSQYVKEDKRYCCYYLIRYALSFVNPDIRAHNDPARKFCYFHQKLFKQEIRDSMDCGKLCDPCTKELETSPRGKTAVSEIEALRVMRTYVAGDYPHAIVMKGGGVKGLAFAAALVEVANYFYFDRHVGTSAGSIAAILLAASYTPKELLEILSNKDFRHFMDAPFWQLPFNLAVRKGLFPGEHFRMWIADLVGQKTGKIAETKMKDLHGALVYASRMGSGTVVFDSAGERQDSVAAFATRCSMSIPGFFFPQMVDGRHAFDGGLRNNFPLKRFLDDHSGKPFVALYLGKRDDRNKRWFFGSELLDIIIDGEERDLVDKHREDVVVIDTTPVGTVDFNLTPLEKEFLLSVGKAAALRFLFNKKFNDGPNEASVAAAEQAAQRLRERVLSQRKRWRWRRLLVVGLILIALVVLCPLIGHALGIVWRGFHG